MAENIDNGELTEIFRRQAELCKSLADAKRIHSALLTAKGAHNSSLAADAAKRAREELAWAAGH